jgi:hypothetical protein
LSFARSVARRQGAPAAARELASREQVLAVRVVIAVPMLAGMVDGIAEVEVDAAFAPNVREAVAR